MQGVGHANGRSHDAPQEAAKGHNVRAVHLVSKHSTDWRAERLHVYGNVFDLDNAAVQSVPATYALAPLRESPEDALYMRFRLALSTAVMSKLGACMRRA